MHFYRIIGEWDVEKEPELPREAFPSTMPNAVSSTSTFPSLLNEYKKYFTTASCRESVLYRIRELDLMFSTKKRKYILGIQATGQQHTAVAHVLDEYAKTMSKDRVVEYMEKFFNSVFKINLGINFGILEDFKKLYGGNPIYYREKGNTVHKNSDGFLNLYISGQKNAKTPAIAISVSAILAILREPVVIDKILSGKITNGNSLSRELVRISARRSRENIEGYLMVYENGQSLSKALTAQKSYLNSGANGEGSDWLSIFLLAAYVKYIQDAKSLDREITGYSGPVAYITSRSLFLSEFIKNACNKTHMRMIASRCTKYQSSTDNMTYAGTARMIKEEYDKIKKIS